MGIRLIVSSCESPTNFWLQPLMKALSSYLKNTTELINELKDLTVEPDTILVTIDVKSLYTYIPHQEGIEACREALQSNNPTRPDTSECLYMTGSEKTQLSGIFYISRNTTFKYSSHFGSLMHNCRDAKFTA